MNSTNRRIVAALSLSAVVTLAGCEVRDVPNFMIAPQINHMAFSKAQESQGVMYSPVGNPTWGDRGAIEAQLASLRSFGLPHAERLEIVGHGPETPELRKKLDAKLAERIAELEAKRAEDTVKIGHGKGRTLLLPPTGTVPRGFQPTHYPVNAEVAKAMGKVDEKGKANLLAVANAQALKAGDELKNPFKPEEEHLARGEEVFNTFCSPCHAKTGYGDGLVVARGVGMPSFPLATKDAKPQGYKDGHIFHIITYGRGNMGSYASQIAAADRWKAILWLRQLQKKGAK